MNMLCQVFPGDVRNSDSLDRLRALGEQLASSKSPIRLYTPPGQAADSVIEVLTVLASPHRDVQLLAQSLPESLVPRRPPYGVLAEDTLFCDEASYHTGHGHAYEGYGVDPAVGCIAVIRPDGHIGGLYALEDFYGLETYFARVLVSQQSA